MVELVVVMLCLAV